ncbi:hypothetical protein [Enterobacter asburiae]|uniref:hypothetical protein n=1 Tax=Enterobacter asburiae TaxID=61645 RepID=UPI00190BB6BA|nr:hypothetical protein [Enterobacter asburiae]EMB6149231.1 hypothetical protein [Enterobacter asburiae]MBK4466834.1 hypothetical protein [Enterobacter asburiae]MBK4575426.1 hypothetical protein [Enterobacter asburiae]BEK73206.1 hypothetical protein EATA6166_10980 [Enterobacter asburiae]HAS1419968.1 hypothetical protein [Enterobacter asburiae]
MSDSTYNMYSLVVSILALLLSLYTLFKSRKDVKFAQKNANEALKLQHGTIELQIRTGITNARNTINNLTPILTPYLAKKQAGSLSVEESYSLDLLYKAYDSCIEDLLNQYDEACKKYIDGKIDRATFKETYFHEIKNITSSQDLSSYYNLETTKYTSTLRVREEWITD